MLKNNITKWWHWIKTKCQELSAKWIKHYSFSSKPEWITVGDFLNTDNIYLTAGSLERSESQGKPIENANILVPRESDQVSACYLSKGGGVGGLVGGQAWKG